MTRPVPDEVILGLIKKHPMHGYQLLEPFRSKDQLGRIWTLSTSQMYAVLNRLESKGAIDGKEVTVPDAPSKVVYSITNIGNQMLEQWLFKENPPASIHLIRVIFISRLYIANLLGFETGSIITRQRLVCQKLLDKFQAEDKEHLSSIESLTVRFVIGQLKAAISWLDECSMT